METTPVTQTMQFHQLGFRGHGELYLLASLKCTIHTTREAVFTSGILRIKYLQHHEHCNCPKHTKAQDYIYTGMIQAVPVFRKENSKEPSVLEHFFWSVLKVAHYVGLP